MNNPFAVAKCLHPSWKAGCNIIHLENIDRYYAEVFVVCVNCNVPMRFIGLPIGFMLNLPTMSPDGVLASLPCHPIDEMMPEEKVRAGALEAMVIDGNVEEH